jgi:Cellulose binding domain
MSASSRPRRSPTVILLDALLRLATAVQTGGVPGAGAGGRRRPDRTAVAWLLAGLLVAVGGTGWLVVALLRNPAGLADLPPGVVAAPPARTSAEALPSTVRPSLRAATTPTASTPGPSRSVEKGRSAGSSSRPAAGGAHLTAGYTAADGLLGYRANVTVTSHGPGTSDGWKLTITMPRPTLRLVAVSGASVKQNGSVWTFTPTEDSRRIPAGDSAVVVFDVRGATLVDGRPTACQLDGEACTGLTEPASGAAAVRPAS